MDENINRFYEQEVYGIPIKKLQSTLEYCGINYDTTMSKSQLQEKYRQHLLNTEFNLYDLNIERLHFLKEYIKYNELASFAHLNKMPMKADIGIISSTKRNISNENQKYSYSVYKIIMDEIQFLPELNTIEDVLRLRTDNKISDFKEVIFEWSKAVKNGDYKDLHHLKKDIKKSSDEFKRMKKYKKVGGWVTYASLPFIAIDLVTQIPVGSLFTAIGGAVQFEGNRLSKKNQWLLFGNHI